MRRFTKALLAAAFVAALAVVASGVGNARDRDRGDDAEIARQAVQSGTILPLVDILARLQGSLGGRVIEVELDREDGRLVYEIKVISDTGQVIEYEVDAASAAILKTKTKKR